MRRQAFMALDVWRFDADAIHDFTQHLRIVLRDDNGGASALAVALGVEPYECLRFILGAPENWFTTKRQRLAEAVYAQTFEVTMDEARARWVIEGFWSPTAKRRAYKPVEGRFDLAFAASLPVTEDEWNTLCRVPDFIAKTMADTDTVRDRFRAYVALAAFGFPEPGHFFVPRQDVVSAADRLPTRATAPPAKALTPVVRTAARAAEAKAPRTFTRSQGDR